LAIINITTAGVTKPSVSPRGHSPHVMHSLLVVANALGQAPTLDESIMQGLPGYA